MRFSLCATYLPKSAQSNIFPNPSHAHSYIFETKKFYNTSSLKFLSSFSIKSRCKNECSCFWHTTSTLHADIMQQSKISELFFDTLFRRHQTIQTQSDVFSIEMQRKLPVLFKLQACRAFPLTAMASASNQLVVFHAASVEARRPQSYAPAASSVIEFRMRCFLQLTFFWLTHCTVDLLTQQVNKI